MAMMFVFGPFDYLYQSDHPSQDYNKHNSNIQNIYQKMLVQYSTVIKTITRSHMRTTGHKCRTSLQQMPKYKSSKPE